MQKSRVVPMDLKQKGVLGVSIVGLILCVVIALVEQSPWLQGLCGFFSGGCRDTLTYTVLGVPVWILGLVFYALLVAALLFFRGAVMWGVAVGTGVEVALVHTMFTIGSVCVFCIANLVLMIAIVVLTCQKKSAWQFLSVCFFTVLFSLVITRAGNGAPASVPPDREDVAAQYGDDTITFEELDMPIASKIYELERGIYQLRMDRLNAILGDALIEKEANSRGISVDDLLREVVPPAVMAVTDQEVDKYYQDNQERLKGWTGPVGELKNRIRSHLEQQKRYEAISRYAVSLRPKYGVTIHLSEPAGLNIKINTEGSPALGPENAAVTIVQFSDYRCPACKKAHATVTGLKASFKDKVRWVFKDFPLRRHPDAHISAEAARCAGEQGKFWEFQDVLYAAEGELNKEKLVDLAAGAGLNKEAFSACLASEKYVQGVDKDIRDGRQVGVDRTPCFFINGKMMTGSLAPEVFRSAIEAELKNARAENNP